MLIVHIFIAAIGLALSSVVYFKPSKTSLQFSKMFVVATFATGSYLVYLSPSHLPSACLSGLVYLSVAFFGIIGGYRKLQSINS